MSLPGASARVRRPLADSYTGSIASRFSTARPGVLSNDTDPSGYPLTATAGTPAALNGKPACASVTLNADGSFTATPPAAAATCTFTYQAQNSQGTLSTAATVTVTFVPAGMKSGLNVAVVDATNGKPITDYRWTIQEDLTFKVDPKGTPALGTRTLGTSFHKSHMSLVASGCVGAVSCGSGQQVRGTATGSQPETLISDAVLDPNKNYYISILPGDAGDPVVNGGNGHMMGGAEIKPQVGATTATLAWNPVTVALQATPLDAGTVECVHL